MIRGTIRSNRRIAMTNKAAFVCPNGYGNSIG